MPHKPRKISKPPEGKFGKKHQILSSIIGLVIVLGGESITTNAEKRRGGKYDDPLRARLKTVFKW